MRSSLRGSRSGDGHDAVPHVGHERGHTEQDQRGCRGGYFPSGDVKNGRRRRYDHDPHRCPGD